MARVGMFVAFTLLLVQGCTTFPDEKRLIKTLLDQYEKVGLYGRPVFNTSESLSVKFGLALIQGAAVAESEHSVTLRLSLWHRYQWRDNLLTWKPADFGGVNAIRFPVSKIWKPDIMNFYGSPTTEVGSEQVLAVAFATGEVLWIPPWQSQVTCPKNGDTFTCELRFGSWTYSDNELDLQLYEGNSNIDLSDYMAMYDYSIVDNSGKLNRKKYPCCVETYTTFDYTIKLKRSSSKTERDASMRAIIEQ